MVQRGILTLAVVMVTELAAQDKSTTVPKIVKFPELVQAIQAHKGRVVVVDFWANY